MGATKARSNNRPILDPPKAVLNPHSDLAQLSVEGLVFLNKTSAGKAGGLEDVNRSKRLWLLFQEPPKGADMVKPGAR